MPIPCILNHLLFFLTQSDLERSLAPKLGPKRVQASRAAHPILFPTASRRQREGYRGASRPGSSGPLLRGPNTARQRATAAGTPGSRNTLNVGLAGACVSHTCRYAPRGSARHRRCSDRSCRYAACPTARLPSPRPHSLRPPRPQEEAPIEVRVHAPRSGGTDDERAAGAGGPRSGAVHARQGAHFGCQGWQDPLAWAACMHACVDMLDQDPPALLACRMHARTRTRTHMLECTARMLCASQTEA
eukprot:366278-Chlamydomonas_euryale.AAC.2